MKKRSALAIALLAVVAGMCVTSILVQMRTSGYLLNLIGEIRTAYDAKDEEECLRLSRQFAEEYVEKTQHFSYFMRHADVAKIEETVVTLPILLESGDMEHFPAELERCRNQLEKLSELELPLPENIL